MSNNGKQLAIDGGDPVRTEMLQYGKQSIDDTDKDAVLSVLDENKYLTTGPRVTEFENIVKEYIGTEYAVAVNSGTAALHTAIAALNLLPGDEVIVAAISFIATGNAVLYAGCIPVFCDVDQGTLNIDPDKIPALVTPRTRAVMAVDFTGQGCDYKALAHVCRKYNLVLIEDAAHSLGARIDSVDGSPRVGAYADLTTFSFHPVKNITTCEGGMITTNNKEYYNRMMRFRNHGINKDYVDRASHEYDMILLGYNLRIPDLLCALGINQMKRLDKFVARRKAIAEVYDKAFERLDAYIRPLEQRYDNTYHIYIIKLLTENLTVGRDVVFEALRAEGIGVNVHYKPIYLHSYYHEVLGMQPGLCPVAEGVYKRIITLPLYPEMTEKDINDVVTGVEKVINFYRKHT